MLTRRLFTFGLIAAPVVVKAESLMKVRGLIIPRNELGLLTLRWRLLHHGQPYRILAADWNYTTREIVDLMTQPNSIYMEVLDAQKKTST